MALTAKLQELWASIPEGLDKSSQYTIKIGKEVAYKGDLTGNSKLDSMSSEDVDAVIAAIQGGNQKKAITITNTSKEKLFYRDSRGKTQVNTFEKPLEIDELDEETVSTPAEIQSAIDAFGLDPEELAPEPPLAPENALPSAIYYIDNRMIAAGRGMFPYECIAKDQFPAATIYYGQGGGWIHEFGPNFLARDASRDEFEPIQTLTRAQIAAFQYNGIDPYTPEQSAVVSPEPEKAARRLSSDRVQTTDGIQPIEPEEPATPAQIEALKEELATGHLDLARERGEVFITDTREGNLRLTRLDGYLDVFELTKTVAPGLEVSLAGGYEDVIRMRLKELYTVGEPELEVEEIAPKALELDPVETPDADGFAVGDRVQFISPNPISYDVIPPSHQTVGEVLEVNRSGESLLIQFNDGEPPEFWDSINFEPENQIAEKVEFVDRRAVDKSITFAELEGQSAAETQQPSEPINVLDQLAVGDRQLEELKAATGLSEENLIEFLNTVQSAADKKLERLEEDFYDPEEEYAELEAEFSDTTTINYDPREESEWDTVNEAPEIESTARPSLSPYIEPYLPIEGAESNFESFYEWAENSEVGLNFSISKQDQAERDMGMFFLAPEAATINLTTQINLEFRKINYELADAQSESIAIFITDMEGNSAAILKKTKHSETVEYTGELRNAEALTSNYKDLPNKFHLALGIVETANQDRQAQALETEPAPQTDSHYIHLVSSPLGEGLGEGEIIGPFESLDAAVEFRRNVITQNPEVFLAGTFNESFFDPSEIDQAVAPGVLLEAIRSTIPSGIANTPEQSIAPKTDIAPEPAITPKRAPEKPNRFSFKGLGKAFQEKLQETFAAQKDKLPASAIALLELHDSKLKDPALAWVSRKLEEAKPELTALREQIQKTSVDAARKGLEAIGNIPNAILEQSVSNAVVNVMDKLGSDTEIEGTQHYLSENYVIARNGNSYQLKDLDGKELLYFDQGKLGNTVTSNSLNRLQVSDLLRANQQITLMSETPSLQEKVSLGNIAPLFSREKLKREQDCQVSGILKAAIAIRGQPQPNGDRVFAGETFHAKQSGDRIQLSRSDGADLLFAIDATSKNAEVNNLNPKEFAQILKFGAALDQVKTSQAKAQAKPSLAAR